MQCCMTSRLGLRTYRRAGCTAELAARRSHGRTAVPSCHAQSVDSAAQYGHSSAQKLPSKTGVVLVDHGSKKKDSNEQLVAFRDLYQQITKQEVLEVAHMELAEPTIEQAVGKCVAQGARLVVVAPYFLSRGRHIQEDIPALVRDAQEKYPGVEITIADPLGKKRRNAMQAADMLRSTPSTSSALSCAERLPAGCARQGR